MSATSALLFGIWIGFTSAVVLILPLWLGHRARDHSAAPPTPPEVLPYPQPWETPRRIVPLDAGTRSLELDMSGWEWKRKQARDSHGRFI